MQVTALDADLDGIALIDGLPERDRSTYQDTQKLINLINSIAPQYLGPNYECNSKSDYLQTLESLTRAAGSGRKYLLHFECHGSKDAIGIGSDKVTWQEQAPYLSKLNLAMQGQLVIDLSACYGIYSSTMAGLCTTSAPFYGVIAPAKSIAMECASIVTAAFYRAYLQEYPGQLDLAVDSANKRLRYPAILRLRSEAYERIRQQGYPFRPNADDREILRCRPDGSVFVSPR